MTIPASGFATFEAPMSHETFGGNINKKNYGNQPIVTPVTDTDCTQGIDAARTLARAQWTMPFAVLRVNIGTSTPSSSISVYKSQHGVGLTFKPAITWTSTGLARITWATTFTDEYSVQGTLAITMASAAPVGTTFLAPVVNIIDAHTIDLYHFDAAGNAVASRASIVTVHTMGNI